MLLGLVQVPSDGGAAPLGPQVLGVDNAGVPVDGAGHDARRLAATPLLVAEDPGLGLRQVGLLRRAAAQQPLQDVLCQVMRIWK